MSRSVADKALRRSYGVERTLSFLVGLAVLAAAAAALLVGFGMFGQLRAERPLLDPMVVDWLAAQPTIARIGAIVTGVLLAGFGLWWFLHAVRPERRPDLTLRRDQDGHLTVTAAAIEAAVQADAEQVNGVSKVRARTVGSIDHPALRLSVWLHEGADLKAVWQALNERVLAHARESLGLDTLPTAIRLQLDAARRERVR